MTALRFAPVDAETGTLLDLIADDPTPLAVDDRERIEAAILHDADTHGGAISANRVRVLLAGRVNPNQVGPAYRRLCLAGVIEADGYEISDDLHGRNSGKPTRTYRLRT